MNKAKISILRPNSQDNIAAFPADNSRFVDYHGGQGGPPMDDWQQWRNGVDKQFINIDNRLAKVEKGVSDLSKKIDSRFKGFAALVVTLIVAVLGVWYLIDQRQESWIQHIQTNMDGQLDRHIASNNRLLEEMDKRWQAINAEQQKRFEIMLDTLDKRADRIERSLE